MELLAALWEFVYCPESYLQSLQHNAHSKPPVNYCLSAALYCPAITRTVPVSLLRSFVSVCMTETGNVMNCSGSTQQ
jgi:hypothetical protein